MVVTKLKLVDDVSAVSAKLLDLRVTHNGVKDKLERLKLRNAALRRDNTEWKDGDSGAVAKLALQHQKDMFELKFLKKTLISTWLSRSGGGLRWKWS